MHTITNHAHCCYTRLFCPEGHPAGWSTSSSFGQADIHDHHLSDFQLVASDYTDCLLRYTSLSYISSQKAGHNTCHLQVHQQLTLTVHTSPAAAPADILANGVFDKTAQNNDPEFKQTCIILSTRRSRKHTLTLARMLTLTLLP